MKNKILILLLIFITAVSCKSQKYNVEEDLMKCLENSLPDDGKEFKKLISNYEEDLIKAKILKDGSGDSYVELLRKIESGENFDNAWPEQFLERLMRSGDLVKADMKKVKRCDDEIEKTQKIDSIEKIVLDLNKSKSSDIASRILTNLSKDDYEKEFYKFRVLMILDGIKSTPEKSNFIKKLPITTDSLDIYLGNENEIYIEGKLIKIETVDEVVSKYLNDLATSNNINFNSSKNAQYKSYIGLVNQITMTIIKSRNIYSVKEYGTDYENLEIIQKEAVDELFPQDFIE